MTNDQKNANADRLTDYQRSQLDLPATLTTSRLLLREVTEADHACHWQMDSDAEVMRYIVPPDTDLGAHRERFLAALQEGGERFKFLRTIELQQQPGALGWVFLRPTEDGCWLELGYRLLPEAWGQGLVPEASRLLIEHAFETWRAAQVMALITPGNQKSRRVVEKLGFQLTGLSREFYDEEELELWVLSAPA